MGPAADGSGRDYGESYQAFSRRRFLRRTAAAGSAAVVSAAAVSGSEAAVQPASAARPGQPGAPGTSGAVGGPGAAGAAPLSQQRDMLLQVARVGAAYPYELRDGFGETGRARDRATPARLSAAEKRLSPQRLQLARAGADALIAKGLLGASQARMLDGIGRYAAGADAQSYKALVAFVALGSATLIKRLDPSSDAVAKIWLGGLRRVHRRGQQPRPVRHR